MAMRTVTRGRPPSTKSAPRALKDPHGGLTAAGRAWFKRRQGAHLKPGVNKPKAQMTPEEMRRKGSWATRFYGRKGALPPLRKPSGEPTRYALTAAAWGEPVPTTVAAAKRIAAKGRRLLAGYAKKKQTSTQPKSTRTKVAKHRRAKPQRPKQQPAKRERAKRGRV